MLYTERKYVCSIANNTVHISVSDSYGTILPNTNTCKVELEPNSMERARNTFIEYFKPETSQETVMYVKLETSMDLRNYSVLERNMLLEWQWVKKKHFFVMWYPVDIDILTFDIISSAAGYRTSKINLQISNFESCTFKYLISEVEKLLWRDLFLNETKSYLCNRKETDDSLRKKFMFYAFMVWVGYDLNCSIHKNSITYKTVEKETSPLEITLVCVLLSLYYPLIFYLIEMEPLLNKLKQLREPRENEEENSSDEQLQPSFVNEDLTAYNENDAPFGFHRALLKLFYIAKVENSKDSKGNWKLSKRYLTNIAACRITTLYFFILLGFSVPRFCLTHIRHPAYDDVYRLGIPFLNSSDLFPYNCILYFSGIFLGAILLKICYMIMSSKGISVKRKEVIIRNTILYNGCFFLSNHSGNDIEPDRTLPKTLQEPTPSHSETSEAIALQSTLSIEETQTSIVKDGNDDVTDFCCCKVSIPIEEFVPEDNVHYTQNRFCLKFVERFVNIFSRGYWASLWGDAIYCCFTCHCNSKSVIFFCCLEKIICVFSLIPFVILNILTGLFPLFWIIMYCPFFFTKYIIQRIICCICQCCKCKCTTYDGFNKCVTTICFLPIYLIVFAFFVFLQWILLSANIYVLRSLLYLTFVAMSFSLHLLRVIIVIIVTIGYVGLFLYEFIREYSTILKVIFEEKLKMEKCKTDLELEQNDQKAITVSEAEFDRVMHRFYDFRQRAFVIFVKILLCTCFIVIATKVLFHNDIIDKFGAEYIIKLAFIAFSPKLLFDMVGYREEDFKDTIDKNREQIRKTLDISLTGPQEFETQCCECYGWARNLSGGKCCTCCTCTSCIQHCCNIGCCPSDCEENCSCCTCPLLSTFCCLKCTCNIGGNDIHDHVCCCFTCRTKTPSVSDPPEIHGDEPHERDPFPTER